MSRVADVSYAPVGPGEVLAPDLVGQSIGAPCRPGESATEVIHVSGAWEAPNPLTATVDVIYKGHRYTVTFNLATDTAMVRQHVGKERKALEPGSRRRRHILVEANRVLQRLVDSLPLFAGEDDYT